MASLFQMLTRAIKKDSPKTTISQIVVNPLKAKIGSSIQFDLIDYNDMTFFVQEIKEVTRMIEGKNFPFVDYKLLARPLGGDDVEVILRLMPVNKVQIGDDLTHNTLLLYKHDSLAFDQGLRDAVNDNEFVTHQDGTETGRYWRINDVKDSYKTTVKIIDAENEKTEKFKSQKIEYWDYWREFENEANIKETEYLFVEMDTDNGWFTILKGLEINTKRVDVR